jgi:DNA-binding NarL/FixJ family response regulator
VRTGRERVRLLLTIESVGVLAELGRTADALAAGADGVELARLSGNPRVLLWAHSAFSAALLVAGQVEPALRQADAAVALNTPADFHATGHPGWCLGAALTAAGNPLRAVTTLAAAFGGARLPELLACDRPAAAADFVEANLAAGDIATAETTLAALAAGADPVTAAIRVDRTPAARIALARSAVLLARDRASEALVAAQSARADAAGAPLLALRARLAEGVALAAAGERREAIDALVAVEADFDRAGALRGRDEAARALRRLGHRVVRAAGDGAPGPLTAREREIADLVVAGRTNREIAAQLVLSTRTVDAHLRNIYGKLGVRSRVELAKAHPSANAAPSGGRAAR